jgi:hypothetical protein
VSNPQIDTDRHAIQASNYSTDIKGRVSNEMNGASFGGRRQTLIYFLEEKKDPPGNVLIWLVHITQLLVSFRDV